MRVAEWIAFAVLSISIGGAVFPSPGPGRSAYGADVTPPSAPTGLTPTAGDAQVSLAWSHASPGDVAEYVVEFRCPSGSGSYAEDDRPTTTSEIVLGLTNGVECDFRVAAEDAANNLSAYAGPVQATPEASGSVACTFPAEFPCTF